MTKKQKCELKALYRAYKALGKATPISADCGKLCNAACCKSEGRGTEEELGMLLFPGEELIFAPFLKKESIRFHGKPAWFVTCKGRCIRSLRPLSCRIFPLLPYVAKEDRVLDAPFRFAMIPDPRGKYLCPLIAAGSAVEEAFYEAAAEAVSELGKCRAMRAFLFRLSETADEYLRFTEDV